MIDYAKLKRLAEAAAEHWGFTFVEVYGTRHADIAEAYIAAANPAVILDLLAENARLRMVVT